MFQSNSFKEDDSCALHSSKKVEVCFNIISNLEVTTRVSANNVRGDLFS